MKRFLVRAILLFGLVIGSLLLINNYCLHSNIYRNVLAHQDTLKFEKVPQQIQIANLGSSHGARGFSYDNLDPVAFNFALAAQSLTYDANILDFYQENIARGATIIIPLSYFSVYWDELEKDDFVSQNARYYTFLDAEHIRRYDARYGFLVRNFWILTRSPDNIVSDVRGSGQQAVPRAGNTGSVAGMDKETLEAQGLRAWKRHWKFIGRNDDYSWWEQENANALERIMEICRTNGFVPVLITTPYLDEYSRHYPQDFLRAFDQSVRQFANSKGILYLDYAFDERFRRSPELFMNSDHLNQAGALMFTEIVLEDIGAQMQAAEGEPEGP